MSLASEVQLINDVKGSPDDESKRNSYDSIISEIFSRLTSNPDDVGYLADGFSLEFTRGCIKAAAKKRGVEQPKNLGDVVYTYRYRRPLPDQILALQPEGKEWLIIGDGIGRYNARLATHVRLTPNPDLATINIPDDTSPIQRRLGGKDEQFMLTRLRESRVIGIFLQLTTWTSQNHLRTTVKGMGQIEIDEIYTAIDRNGQEYVIPVQAKGHSDRHSIVQTHQDIAYCRQEYPDHICIPVSAQFMADGSVAMFRIEATDEGISVEEEIHYRLVTEWPW